MEHGADADDFSMEPMIAYAYVQALPFSNSTVMLTPANYNLEGASSAAGISFVIFSRNESN